MPRTKEQYEAMREATREKIHSAAVALFSQKGLAATSVQEIADAAQISTGLMYRHYKSKEELFAALVMEALEGLEAVGRLFENESSPVRAIQKFTKEFLDELSRSEEFTQYMMMLSQPIFANQDFPWVRDILERDKILLHQLAGVIEKGQASGELHSGDPLQMAEHYFSVIQGVCMMKYVLKDIFILPSAEMMTRFLIKERAQYHESE